MVYHFRWAGYDQGADQLILHDKWLESYLVRQDRYALNIKGVPDKEFKPVNSTWILFQNIENPYKAFFRIQNWLGSVEDLSASQLRKLHGSMKFEQVVASLKSFVNKANKTLAQDAYKGIIDEKDQASINPDDPFTKVMLKLYGINISNVQLVEVRLDENVKKDSTADIIITKWKQKMIKEGLIEQAEGDRIARETRANGFGYEEDLLLGIAQSYGDLGALYLVREGLKDNQFAATYWGSNLQVQGLIQRATGQTLNADTNTNQLAAIVQTVISQMEAQRRTQAQTSTTQASSQAEPIPRTARLPE